MKTGIKASSIDRSGYGRFGENTYKKLKEHGFSCSDFNMSDTDSVLYREPFGNAKEMMLKEKELAQNAGIEITQVHGPWRWPPKDDTDEDRCERMEKMKRSIFLTSHLGCKNWVIHPIMPYGINEKGTDRAMRTWEMNLDFFRKLLETAKDCGVTICLENMPMREFSMATPKDVLRFVEEINDENMQICLDTGHVAVFGDLSLTEETKILKNRLRVLHVHDNKCGLDLHLMPYTGIIDWKGFAQALKEVGYCGSFSLELMPPAKLSDALFEKYSIMLAHVAKEITAE